MTSLLENGFEVLVANGDNSSCKQLVFYENSSFYFFVKYTGQLKGCKEIDVCISLAVKSYNSR